MRWVVLVVAAATLLAGVSRPQAQTGSSVCDLQTTERVVAIGDVHGAYDRFRAILRAAGLIDARDRWSGGRAIFVQTGDVFDRGTDSRKALDLLRRLERDARRAGGQVVPLVGNHEVMRLLGDWRYVSAGEFEAFRAIDSVEVREAVLAQASSAAAARARTESVPFDPRQYREAFLKEFPLGFFEMQLAFTSGREYGDWIRGRSAVARVNGVAFVHGGISREVAAMGCAGINAAITKEMRLPMPITPEQAAAMLSVKETGPLWYRELATEPEPEFAPNVTAILETMGARAIVIGHTVAIGKITPRFERRVIQIDTGMLGGEFYPKGQPAALEIKGEMLTAIYVDRREPLGALPPSTPAR